MLPQSLEGHDRRLSRLEERDKTIDQRIQNVHTKMDEHKTIVEKDIKRISSTLDEIKNGQHSQQLVNQKMDFTLDSINREREREKEDREKREQEQQDSEKESRKDVKQIKYIIYGMIATVGATFIGSLIRLWLGI